MRLFLSSQDLGNYPEVAARLAGKNKKAAFIRNAQDDKPPEERNFTTLTEKEPMFENAGFEFEEIDLREYFGKSTELAKKLTSFGSVWMAGGNTFILRRAMKVSGMDDILKELLAEDRILYGGWSAGSCITAPSLHGIEFGDRPHPDAVPDIYPVKETIWEGLGLVPFMIVPHCDSDWYGEYADMCIEYLKKHKLPYRVISDGQVIVIDGDKEELLQ